MLYNDSDNTVNAGLYKQYNAMHSTVLTSSWCLITWTVMMLVCGIMSSRSNCHSLALTLAAILPIPFSVHSLLISCIIMQEHKSTSGSTEWQLFSVFNALLFRQLCASTKQHYCGICGTKCIVNSTVHSTDTMVLWCHGSTMVLSNTTGHCWTLNLISA